MSDIKKDTQNVTVIDALTGVREELIEAKRNADMIPVTGSDNVAYMRNVFGGLIHSQTVIEKLIEHYQALKAQEEVPESDKIE